VSAHPPCLLDANVFIEACNRYYAFDIVPAFWTKLVELASNVRVLSIDRVKDELQQPVALNQWANGSFHSWFVSTNENDVIQAYAAIMQWAQGQTQYSAAAKAEFAGATNADPWLVAYAQVKGLVVVTHETLNTTIKRKIPIPNVCVAFGVQYMDSFAMLRALQVTLA
jgi:hypothetical protein